MRIQLAAADRERWACPEWMLFDPTSVLTSEAEAYEEAGGELKYLTSSRTTGWWRAMVWLTLHRAGIAIKFDDCHFNLMSLELEDDTPGKASSSGGGASPTPPTSRGSTTSRPRTSRRST